MMMIVALVFAALFLLLYGSESVRSSIPTVPTLTEEQVVAIMRTDIQKRVGNVSVSMNDISESSDERLPLIYYRLGDNMAFRINGTSHEVMASCNPSVECFLNNREEALASVNGRLFYFVDGAYSGEGKSSPSYYYIDARNGDILWSYIGEDVYPELRQQS